MSLAGLTSPSTWVTSSSRKTRVTWQIAEDSRMWARNLLPSPSPWEAPRTMPAMSTNSTVAGRILAELEDLGELRQPLVGDADDADVGLDRRERVVRREDVVLGQSVEERRLARVGETDDADGESHGRGVYGGDGVTGHETRPGTTTEGPTESAGPSSPPGVRRTPSGAVDRCARPGGRSRSSTGRSRIRCTAGSA